MEAVVSRLESVATRLESLAVGKGGSSGDNPETNPSVVAFDEFLKNTFTPFRQLFTSIGGDVESQGKLVEAAFQAQRTFLVTVAKCKTPPQNVLQKLLEPLSNALSNVTTFRDKNRGSKEFNHLSAIAESIPALGWVTVSPRPGNYIKEMKDAGQFYANRVLRDFKEKGQAHVDWVKSFNKTLASLQEYVSDFHQTGIQWNPSGCDPSSASSAPAPTGAAPPPGPPPPGPPPPPAGNVPAVKSGGDAGALFGEINKKGNNIAAGLRKVTKDQMTHKNPDLRASGVVADKPKPASKPAVAAKPQVAAKKNPVFELRGKKWIVEHQENQSLVIDDTKPSYGIYIFNCKSTQIQVKGKVNSIVLDSCKKSGLVFDDCIATVEMVNCQSVQVQVMGAVPTVSIDKTDGCQVYLSKAALNCDIVTAKSSEMNILVPLDDGDFQEFALPEQFKTSWNGKKFVTECTESLG